MPSYIITGPDGKKYKVTGPDAQGAMNALRKQLGATPSGGESASVHEIGNITPDIPIKPRAQMEYDNLSAWQKPFVAADDLASLAVNGITSGFGDKALAGLDSLIGRGSYEDQLAIRRGATEDARTRAGLAGSVAEIGGAVLPAAKLAKLGLTATRIPGMVGRVGGMAADGAAFGAVNALGNDQDIGIGTAVGAVLGAGGQAVGKVLGAVAKPIMARINPQKASNEVLLKAINEAGTNPSAIAQDLAAARADGQTSYALMDAMGYPGQRLASTVVRNPNDGRAPMVEFLENRQAGQGRRVSNILSEGFGSPETAAQRGQSIASRRDLRANADYNAARAAATDVDTMPAVDAVDNLLGGSPFPRVANDVTPDSLEGILTRVRNKLINSDGSVQTVGFDKVLRIKQELDDDIGKALRAGEKNKARMLAAVRSELDTALQSASVPYARAAKRFARSSKAIDAIDKGKSAAMRGRPEDTIPAFGKLNRMEKIGFRSGYVDPLIESAQTAAVGANKVRPLINDAYAAEFPAFAAPGKGEQMGRRIAREKTMFDTMAEALRGSKTANNLADEADMSIIDPSIIGNFLSGNLTGAAKNAVLQGISALKGQPPAVRKLLSDSLRVTDPNMALQNLNQAVAQINASQQKKQAIVRMMMLLGTSGAIQSQK